MKRIIKSAALPLLGIGLILAGFAYDVFFAGIPYQDPTTELQAQWEFHQSVANILYRSGGVVLLCGILAAPFIWRRAKK